MGERTLTDTRCNDGKAPNADLVAAAFCAIRRGGVRTAPWRVSHYQDCFPSRQPQTRQQKLAVFWVSPQVAGVSSLRRVLQRHRPGPGTVPEGQSRPADIVAFAPFDHTVDDAALHLPPESVGREAKLLGDQLRLNDEAIL